MFNSIIGAQEKYSIRLIHGLACVRLTLFFCSFCMKMLACGLDCLQIIVLYKEKKIKQQIKKKIINPKNNSKKNGN